MIKAAAGRTMRRVLPSFDRVIFRAARALPGGTLRSHVLVPAPGGGNIGDEAMFTAFAENVSGKVLALVASRTALSNPDPDRVTIVHLPALMRLSGPAHWVAVWRTGRLSRIATTFTVTGADIMDGGYNPVASVARWNLLTAFASAGVPSRVLGFSWNGRAPQIVLDHAKRAHAAGARLLLRDPVSLNRIQADGMSNAIGTSDSVFLMRATDDDFSEADWIKQRVGKRRIAVVNASALVARQVDTADTLGPVVDHLLGEDFDVVVLPHVERGARGDIHECRILAAGRPSERVLLVDRLLPPAAVRWIAGQAEIVVTGRMHLSILALSQRVPAIVIATQGKVEGLAALFDSPDIVVEPGSGMGAEIVERLSRGRQDEMRTRINISQPAVAALASKNFDTF